MIIRQLEEKYVKITPEDEEIGGISYGDEDESLSEIDIRSCLVGHFLPIDFQVMQHKMASSWKLGRGMYVKKIENNLYLFQFYHDIDIVRVLEEFS